MTTIAKPFGALLMWLYEFTSSYGLAVILFALIVKIILLPFQMKSKRGTMRMSRLTEQMKELEKRHGANKQKYNVEVQKLYQREGVNPMSGCIWTLIPFPILIALYYAIRLPITTMMGVSKELVSKGGAIYTALEKLGFDFAAHNEAYIEIAQAQFISKPENWGAFSGFEGLKQIDYSFIGLDLGQNPNFKLWEYEWSNPEALLPALGLFAIPIVAALLTMLQTKISTKMNPAGQSAEAQSANGMLMMMPLMTLVFAFMMPAALGIYWIASTFFAMIQDIILNLYYKKKLDEEDAERREAEAKREAELEEKRKAAEELKAKNATAVNPNTSKRKQQQKQRQEQTEKAAEWERAHSGKDEKETGPSQVGNRRYARGRAYDPDRYGVLEAAEEENVIPEIDEIYEAEAAAKAAEETETVETEETEAVEEIAEVSEDVPAEENGDNKEQ